jgi:hypothetical protein
MRSAQRRPSLTGCQRWAADTGCDFGGWRWCARGEALGLVGAIGCGLVHCLQSEHAALRPITGMRGCRRTTGQAYSDASSAGKRRPIKAAVGPAAPAARGCPRLRLACCSATRNCLLCGPHFPAHPDRG